MLKELLPIILISHKGEVVLVSKLKNSENDDIYGTEDVFSAS